MKGITEQAWGSPADGSQVTLFTLHHDSGMQASVSTYGATLVKLLVPDREGRKTDVILGFDQLEEYLADTCYFGRVIGRVANRIDRARFQLHGTMYDLDVNHGRHHLHGGSCGLHTRIWTATPSMSELGPSLTLSCTSPDRDQGYPGEVAVSVTYTVTARSLVMEFRAECDRTTPVNLTGHAYFNLSGVPDLPVSDHEVTLFCARYLAADAELIPTGEIRPVRGTRFDLNRPTLLADRTEAPSGLTGYDTYFILNRTGKGRVPAARVRHIPSGRTLEISTTQPGVHFYTGGGIPPGLQGKAGISYGPESGLCLETQGYPDAPNHPGFPSVFLAPGTTYEHSTEYHFPLS